MRARINPKFITAIETKLEEKQPIEVISSCRLALQWLVETLIKHGTPYKIHSGGLGVQTVTTNTDKCPLCKKSL